MRDISQTWRRLPWDAVPTAVSSRPWIKTTAPKPHTRFLLKIGYWNPDIDPYPSRLGVNILQSQLPVPELPAEARRDLTHLVALAIDDASTDIPDDALSLDGARLWVHVADPAAVVLPGSVLDLEARARGATLYLPEGTVHMLPAAANAGLALGLSGVSPALSLGLDIDPADGAPSLEIVPSWVRVLRLTYEEADVRLDEDAILAALYSLARRCWERRHAQGAVMIDLPEVDIKVDLGQRLATPHGEMPPVLDRLPHLSGRSPSCLRCASHLYYLCAAGQLSRKRWCSPVKRLQGLHDSRASRCHSQPRTRRWR